MKFLSGASHLPSIHSLFNSYSKLIEFLAGASHLHLCTFLIQFWSKIAEIPLWCLPHPPNTHSLFNSYSKLMKFLAGSFHIPQYTFLMQFLFKTNEIPSWRILPTPLNIPCSILIAFIPYCSDAKTNCCFSACLFLVYLNIAPLDSSSLISKQIIESCLLRCFEESNHMGNFEK